MHALQIGFFLDPRAREPQQLLAEWPSLVDIAESAASDAVQVSVVQAAARTQRIERNSIDYHFVAPERGHDTISTSAAFAQLIASLAPDVFHVHGFGFPEDVLTLARLAPRTPILLQHHADQVPRFWRRSAWRDGMRAAAGLAFTGAEQVKPFTQAGAVDARTRIFDIPESTSRFTPGEQAEARRESGLSGNPCLLWVGHLNANKDPLAVLDGVSAASAQLPGLKLWCCFGTAPLMSAVQSRIAGDPALRDRVTLMGAVPHATVETLMRAADVFVLGSHVEGSGYSVIEALACGLPAVVTDIPSFRALLAGSGAGELWAPGDAVAMHRALLRLQARRQPQTRAEVRAWFEREISPTALRRKWVRVYSELTAEGQRVVA
jgi:glycosyltransferase involved in cell wall biosynthesis